jgi:hypothetical protein
MPTIVKFLIVLAVLAGLVGAGMFYLANFVEPNTRQLTIRVPADRLQPTIILPPQEAAQPPPTVAPAPAAEPE